MQKVKETAVFHHDFRPPRGWLLNCLCISVNLQSILGEVAGGILEKELSGAVRNYGSLLYWRVRREEWKATSLNWRKSATHAVGVVAGRMKWWEEGVFEPWLPIFDLGFDEGGCIACVGVGASRRRVERLDGRKVFPASDYCFLMMQFGAIWWVNIIWSFCSGPAKLGMTDGQVDS